MIKFKFFIIIGILCIAQSKADQCKKILRELANAEGLFSHCVTMHSVPVTICVGCKEAFELMDANYTALKDTANCSAEYFDKDRVNLVAATEESLNKLWTKAYCDDCYVNDNLETFNNLSSAFEGCIGIHKDSPCDSCLLEYKNLNSFYLEMDDHNNGQVCFDIQDSMNRTRQLWSKTYKCCRREFKMTLYLVALSIVCCLPILFYSGTYFFTKWQEREHGMLSNEDPRITPSSSSNSRVGITPNIPNDSVPSTSSSAVVNSNPVVTAVSNNTNSRRNFKKLQESDDSGQSSDDEVLPKPKYG